MIFTDRISLKFPLDLSAGIINGEIESFRSPNYSYLARPSEHVVAFYNQRGTAEQWMKEGKGTIKWTRLSCRSFAANAV